MTSPHIAAIVALSVATLGWPAFAERHVPCRSLPASVIRQAKIEAGDATITGCVKERENGKVTYEVETLKNARSKDITIDASGRVLEVEQEIAAGSLPQPVSDAIAKAALGGKVGKIESVTRGSNIASYETTVVKNGKRREVAFRPPQGTPVKAD